MCGICGVIQVSGEPRAVVAPEVLDAMTDAMTHRGPNDRGTYVAPGVAFGVRRLSIVDVEGGHQPFANESGDIWGMQNGELYNHAEVRVELEADGHRLRSRCDTEVIPHLYERHGPQFPRHLDGKFGIAVWDGRRRRAVLARDRLGVKPLYIAAAGDLLVFASELKSLLASGLVGGELDYEAIDAYLTLGYVPYPSTLLAGVSKLAPGHRLVVEDGGVCTEAYWTHPVPRPETRPGGEEEWARELLARLEEATRRRLMSDVPLGAMLSGGLDSSLIVGLMARNMSEPVKTFSIGFAEAGQDNELADARLVAGAFGADHHEIELSFAHDTLDLEELVWSVDEPLADLSALGFHALSQLAARHVTVALSGQGADELLGGYARHRNAALTERWLRLPRPARGAGLAVARRAGGRLRRAAGTLAAPDAVDRMLALRRPFNDGLRDALACGPLAELDGGAARRVVAARAGDLSGAGVLGATLHLDAQLGMVDEMLHYFDRASMAHSLEVRVPFLDHHLVEFCATIPTGLKVRRLTTKHLLRRAARGLVPDGIIDKRKIGFFNAAAAAWFDVQGRGAVSDYLLGAEPRYAEFLDRRGVERLAAAGRPAANTLLSILMLEVWLSSFLPRALGSARPARERITLAR